MQKNKLILTATLCGALSGFVFSTPTLAQGTTSATVPNPMAGHPYAMALTDPKTGFNPITMPDGDSMGPNIPGRMLVGQLNPTPESQRIIFGGLYLLFLTASLVWTVLGVKEWRRARVDSNWESVK